MALWLVLLFDQFILSHPEFSKQEWKRHQLTTTNSNLEKLRLSGSPN
jgi:hypothetical protein